MFTSADEFLFIYSFADVRWVRGAHVHEPQTASVHERPGVCLRGCSSQGGEFQREVLRLYSLSRLLYLWHLRDHLKRDANVSGKQPALADPNPFQMTLIPAAASCMNSSWKLWNVCSSSDELFDFTQMQLGRQSKHTAASLGWVWLFLNV